MEFGTEIVPIQLTQTEIDNLTNVVNGSIVHNTTLGKNQEYNGTTWDTIVSGGGGTSNHSGLNLDDGTNPHGTTKADVGLGNADNTSDNDKPLSLATIAALALKQDKLIILSDTNSNYQTSTLNVNFQLPGIGITIPAGGGGNYLATYYCDLDVLSNNTIINLSLGVNTTSQNATRTTKRGRNESSNAVPVFPITLNDGDNVTLNVSVSTGTGIFKDKGIILIKY